MYLACIRITYLQFPRTFSQLGRILLRKRAMYEVAPRLHTYLSLVKERAPCTIRTCSIDIGIIKNNNCIIAAELKRDLLQHLPADLSDSTAYRGRPCERNHSNLRMTY